MLSVDHHTRPSCQQLLKSSYLNGKVQLDRSKKYGTAHIAAFQKRRKNLKKGPASPTKVVTVKAKKADAEDEVDRPQ